MWGATRTTAAAAVAGAMTTQFKIAASHATIHRRQSTSSRPPPDASRQLWILLASSSPSTAIDRPLNTCPGRSYSDDETRQTARHFHMCGRAAGRPSRAKQYNTSSSSSCETTPHWTERPVSDKQLIRPNDVTMRPFDTQRIGKCPEIKDHPLSHCCTRLQSLHGDNLTTLVFTRRVQRIKDAVHRWCTNSRSCRRPLMGEWYVQTGVNYRHYRRITIDYINASSHSLRTRSVGAYGLYKQNTLGVQADGGLLRVYRSLCID